MSFRRVTSPLAPEPAPGMWSNCLVAGNVAYISGMTARSAANAEQVSGDNEYEQARLVFGKIRGLVEAAGGTMSDIVKLTIFVTRIANRDQIWKARQEFFSGDFPACSLVEVRSLAKPDIYLEIEGVAHLGGKSA
ncbi:RidA family protein [Aminobacter aganoensis]|uniref:Enamine deaminase RidA (YjgF/YER057c/UK114 family) n=1 Tax=Aminobacter aganoensis TaxID=83264 RepID=A0A7X0FB49_9HYPH|nr:RidA family protein [Aminobacter aganoensis]MBB6356477.1 enamine deaminase RidA (YjgF/YER057c/UK114 family) [Aminobacter aganoensis]